MRVGGRDIVVSGVIVTQHGDDSVEITVSDLVFKLEFREGALPVITATADGKVLTISLTGFDNPLGQGWHSHVGTYNNRELFLAIYVATLGEASKTVRNISYTFSLGAGVGNG
jgi:hypothetical protein